LRADAKRNRDRIVAAARQVVAQAGGNIVLEDVARSAGVGIGTLYRHFPTRQDLMEAAFLQEALDLTQRAEELQQEPSPFEALVDWLRLQMDFGSHGHSMGAAVMAAKQVEGSELQLACVNMREAGTDILRLVHGIVMANAQAPDPERAGRMLDLVVAGIRA
jgi:AcrR family transcriptional regulator